MIGSKALLIYDGVCSYCRRFARIAQRLDRNQRLHIVSYQSPQAQDLLTSQFGPHVGFTLYLFREGRVFWAQSAARETVHHLGLPGWMGWLVFHVYPAMVQGVSRLTGRQQAVCMPGQGACSCAQGGSGSMQLTPAATAQLCAFGS